MWREQCILLFTYFGAIWAQSSPACALKNGDLGVCISYERCDAATNTIIGDQSNIIKPGYEQNLIQCPQPKVCCSFTNNWTTTTTTTTTGTDSVEKCGVQKRAKVSNFHKTMTDEAEPGEFPWAVNLMIVNNILATAAKYKYVGTGSLIHERVVLTAAHVLFGKNPDNLIAVIGEHDQKKKVMEKRSKTVQYCTIHEQYDGTNGDYNFALVFLAESALKDNLPSAGTVCLPPADYAPPAGTRCVFAGWGVDYHLENQNQLVKVDVPMMGHAECERRFQQAPSLGPGFRFLPSLTCAGGEGTRNLCGGAGGSPLVCPMEGQPGRFFQIGIVTWTTDCGKDGAPMAFANVAAVRPWLDEQLDNFVKELSIGMN
ncbi:phenoloxidase-activating factor 2-like isoform X1 [Ostrinia furnacalis]|uniref:phenoloxidase-activating factor 2-like isoform X1 n=1 Tax=Ostrinia furnacalis TaxID=93504 RepID=UPI00103D9C8D|nr:phenoloxidase-activating factor 2-like isoform X1 [Ostrinia furnacalis]